MADNQLFPTFDMPDIPEEEEIEEKYKPSVYFDFEKGDFVLDGSHRMAASSGKDAFIQWCIKTCETEREEYLAYGEDHGVEFESINDVPDWDSKESEIEVTITEALMQHPACERVSDFSFERKGSECYVSFTIKGYDWEEVPVTVLARNV